MIVVPFVVSSIVLGILNVGAEKDFVAAAWSRLLRAYGSCCGCRSDDG